MTASQSTRPLDHRQRGIPLPPVPALEPHDDEAFHVVALVLTQRQKKAYRNRLWERSPHCRFCGRKIVKREDVTIDHLIPQSRGGLDAPANLVLACPQCNAAKGPRTVDEWTADILDGALPCQSVGHPLPEGGAA